MTVVRQGVLVSAVAAVAHLTYYCAMPALVFPDSVRYAALAAEFPARLTTGEWDLVSVPGYPFFLWLCGCWMTTAEAVVLAQHGFAIVTCGLLWLTVRRVCGARGALIGALVVALSPFRHYYAQSVLTESLAEFLLVAGICLIVVAARAPLVRLVVLRGIAGLILGAAVLVRANLMPAMVLSGLIPAGRCRRRRRWPRFATAALASTIGWLCVISPWWRFNARRDVHGLTGSAGYLFNEFANLHGVGEAIALPRESTPQLERNLERIAWQRIRADPAGYARAVVRTAVTMVWFFPIRGDVVPGIPQSRIPLDAGSLRGFQRAPAPTGGAWRRAVHRVLSSVYKVLLSVGWLGLTAAGAAALLRGRVEIAMLTAVPIVGVLALSLLVVNSARYAFPFEALVLGLGLPAGWNTFSECLGVVRAKTGTHGAGGA
ncbi:MAG TPA: hypothetical protein VL403_07590 [Candidatus Kryptonia bacterium]|nr:hypothetical protein [Candidatus Kryptonia bacterium]